MGTVSRFFAPTTSSDIGVGAGVGVGIGACAGIGVGGGILLDSLISVAFDPSTMITSGMSSGSSAVLEVG